MKAGPELDEWIAENVMGYRRMPSAYGIVWALPPGNDSMRYDSFMPKFSTDLVLAFQVVEKIRAHHPYFKLGSHIKGDIRNRKPDCVCTWHWVATTNDPGTTAYGETPAEAICLSAKLWVERRKDETVPEPKDEKA